MGIKEALGFGSGKKIRYAIVGLGDIAQESMLPGIEHTGNSEVTALVTSDEEKARKVGDEYNVKAFYNYDQFDELLKSGTIDAIYLATPNWRHAEFAIPALQAGIHVLVEKPLEINTAKCQEILDAAKTSTARLMVAYRLHFEPATLDLVRKIREGELGDVLLFTSTFSQMVSPDNHRARNADLAGPVFDMGPYPVNAARYVFSAEPTHVLSAHGTRHPESGFDQTFDDTVAVTLAFPGGRIAQFTVSYYGSTVDSFYAVGTKGNILMSPAYMFGKPLEQAITIGKEESTKSFKNTDHFGGEMKYFSDCILNDTEPEPDGQEGYADVRVLEGILEALKTGGSVELKPFARLKRIDPYTQEETLSPKKASELIHTASPSRETDDPQPN